MDIEIEKLQLAVMILAKAIEDGRIDGIKDDIENILKVKFGPN